MNLYTALQKSSGLRDGRNVYVRLVDTSNLQEHDAVIGSAVFIESIQSTNEESIHIYRVKFETTSHVISTVITFGMNGVTPMSHAIQNEDERSRMYIAFI